MDIIRFPSAEAVNAAVAEDRPFIAAVSFSGETAVVCPAGEISDHGLLLASAGFFGSDNFFRLSFDSTSARWDFLCPAVYKGVSPRENALSEFYRDGLRIIPEFLTLMGYFTQIKINNLTGEIWDF
jgi:hypothetical protein